MTASVSIAPFWRARLAASAAACLVLAACGTAKTLVLEPPENAARHRSLRLEEASPTVSVPLETRERFRALLKQALYDKGTFSEGGDLTLRYRFLQVNEGDRFSRWFLGGIGNAGEATMTVEVIYRDRDGAPLARIQVEGKIGSGFFGGSSEYALEKAAEDIANFTATNFR